MNCAVAGGWRGSVIRVLMPHSPTLAIDLPQVASPWLMNQTSKLALPRKQRELPLDDAVCLLT